MPTTHPTARPVGRPTRRLTGVDAARGVALLGMFAVHLLPNTGFDGTPTWTAELARGRSSAAFATLAGVAIALAYGGTRPPRGREWAAASVGLLTRCVLIGALGLALGMLDSGLAVILVYYALLFACAAPLLALGVRTLSTLAVALVVGAPLLSHLLRTDLPRMRGDNLAYADLESPVLLLREALLTGYYPVLSWTAYLVAGLAVGRLALGSRGVAAAVAGVGALLAVGSVLLSDVLVERAGDALPDWATLMPMYGVTPTETWWWLALAEPHSATPFDLAHTIGTALLLLGVALLVASAASALVQPLAWAGGMTLSLYTLHVVLVTHDVGPRDPEQLWFVHALGALAIAAVWRQLADRGPLEEVVSRASRGVRGLVLPSTTPTRRRS